MECTVPVEVHLATEHADIGSQERTVSAALAEVGVALWRELASRLEASLPVPDACPGCGAPVKADGRAPRRGAGRSRVVHRGTCVHLRGGRHSMACAGGAGG